MPADPGPLLRVTQAGDDVWVRLCSPSLGRFAIMETRAQAWIDAAIASTDTG